MTTPAACCEARERALDVLDVRGRHRRDELRYRVDLRYRYAERAADVLYRAAALHASEGDYLRDLVRAVLLHYVGDELVAAFVGYVGVDIRHAYAFRVQETFKEQIVAYRVEVGDAERVGDERARGGAASRPYRDVLRFRRDYDVGDYAEISREVHLLYYVELVFETFEIVLRRIFGLEPAAQPFGGHPAQVRRERLALGEREFRQIVVAHLELYAAPVGDALRVDQRLRQVVSENRPHLLRRAEVVVVPLEAVAPLVGDEAARLHAEKYVVPLRVALLHVMGVVRRDERKVELLRHLDERLVDERLLRYAVRLYLEEEIPLPHYVAVHAGAPLRALDVSAHDELRYLAAETGRRAYQPLAVAREKVMVYARLVVKAVGVRD